MLKESDFEKIGLYIEGRADEREKTEVEFLFLNGEKNYTLKQSLEKDWNKLLVNKSTTEVDLNHILDRVHHMIRKNETLKKQKPLQKFIRIYMKSAAILLIPLLIAGGLVWSFLGNYINTTPNRPVSSTIYAPLGSRVSFNLPDGTSGMLNSGSRLSYSLPFINNRRIKLEGEVWLEVNHDEKHPFEIDAGNSTVKVLGTCLNIAAYSDENYVEVVLQKGKVEFLDKKNNKNVMMLPMERLVSQNGNINMSVTDPAKYNGWTEGKLIFRGDPMDEVARRIERWYNIKVELADKELEKYSFRATFQDDKLEDVVRLLCLSSPISYKITKSILMTDGTIEKEKLTIYLTKR